MQRPAARKPQPLSDARRRRNTMRLAKHALRRELRRQARQAAQGAAAPPSAQRRSMRFARRFATRTAAPPSDEVRGCHALKRCRAHGAIFNRDVNAARNIRSVWRHAVAHAGALPPWQLWAVALRAAATHAQRTLTFYVPPV